jgi:hypothetical protein
MRLIMPYAFVLFVAMTVFEHVGDGPAWIPGQLWGGLSRCSCTVRRCTVLVVEQRMASSVTDCQLVRYTLSAMDVVFGG